MGAFSRFNCFGEQKVRRLEPSEPVRQVPITSQDEQAVSVSRRLSDELEVVEKGDVKEVVAAESPQPQQALSTPTQESSLLAEFKLDLPLSPKNDPLFAQKPQQQPLASSWDPSTTSRQPPSIPQIIRAVSSSSTHSKAGSRGGASLEQVSTKATTPPRSPIESERQQVLPARLVSLPKGSLERKSNELSPSTAEAGPVLATHQATTVDHKAIEASPPAPSPLASPTPAAVTRPLLIPTTSTALHHRRPSFEDDTPTTPVDAQPATSTTATAIRSGVEPARLNPTRLSTAPAESPSSTKVKAEKRKSKLSRFLSIKERKQTRASVVKKDAGAPLPVNLPAVGEKDEGERVDGGGGGAGGRRKADDDDGGVVEGGDDRGKESWEKEVERVRVEGRKWREEGDNESLFCY